MKKISLKNNDTILFQGDSITDGLRGRNEADLNNFLGHGYQSIIASRLSLEHLDENLYFHNRGVSGDTLLQMYARWRVDTFNIKPDILSILIGVNDCDRLFNCNGGTDAEQFEAVYSLMLTETKAALPNTSIVLCEPFYLTGCNANATCEYDDAMNNDVRCRAKIVKQLSKDFNCFFIPIQNMLDEYAEKTEKSKLLWDGVHPSIIGHELIAHKWMETVL